jgi:uncharacterized delta-60 repeat protein
MGLRFSRIVTFSVSIGLIASVASYYFYAHPRSRVEGGRVSEPLKVSAVTPIPKDLLQTPPAQQSATNEVSNFASWLNRYEQATPADRLAMRDEGVHLANVRRTEMQRLIEANPEAALAAAISDERRSGLPREVTELLEEHVSGTGNYYVDCVLPFPGQEHAKEQTQRSVTIGKREYRAYVYGSALRLFTMSKVGVEGIAIGNALALSNQSTYEGRAFGDASLGSSDVSNRALPSWTHGPKKVLMLRVDFSDMPGEPVYALNTNTVITTNYGANLFNGAGGIAGFYRYSSYSNTDLVIGAADISPVYRMPQTALYYAQGDGTSPYSGAIRDAALAAAAADYNLNSYDRLGVVCSDLSRLPNSKVGFAGVANVIGKNFLINGYYDFAVVSHEIGHTYGIQHANWWKPSNNTTIGTESDLLADFDNGAMSFISKEYGDPFDAMGANSLSSTVDSRFHFNHWLKNMLGWIPDASVTTVTTPGIYRVYRFDDGAVNPTNKLALKICRDLRRDFWIGYRRQFNDKPNGAYILFGYNQNRASDLLACNSPGITATNALLQVGQTLVDSGSGVSFTTLAAGGVAPNEYLDIQIAMSSRVSFATNYVGFETTRTNATVVVERLGSSSGVTTANYNIQDSTATNGMHFVASSGTLTWGAGDTSPRTINIGLLDYPASESRRTFQIVLTGVSNGVVVNPGTLTVSLRPPGNYDPNYYAAYAAQLVRTADRQADGKLLMGGSFSVAGDDWAQNNQVGCLARLNPNGSRDYSFNSNPGVPVENYGVNALKIQPDGKILIGGSFTNVHGLNYVRLARLNSDGSVDTSFTPPQFPNLVWDIAVQPDGKIVVVGDFRSVNGQACIGICRLFPNGSVDFIFNNPSYFMSGGMYKVVLDNYDSDNGNEVRIVAAGSIRNFAAGFAAQQQGVIRLKADGSIDPTFNISGSGTDNWVRTLAMQSDGKILLGGDFTAINGDTTKRKLARLNANGSIDNTFTPIVSGSSFTTIFSIFPQADGKIIFGGFFTNVNGVLAKNLTRVTSTGALDSTWDNGVGSENGTGGEIEAFVPLPDGRVIAFGDNRSMRGFVGSFYRSTTTSIALFTGITNLYGLGEFAQSAGTVMRGSNVVVSVQRVGGSFGTVKMDYGTQDGTGIAGTDYVKTQGTLTWNDGDVSPKLITVACPPGARVGKTIKLNLVTPRGGIVAGAIRQMDLTVKSDYNYEVWRAQNFSVLEQADENISGVIATPAGDGVPNLLKYALDLPPFASATNRVPSGLFTGSRLRMNFPRDPIKGDLIYEVQAGNDLGVWDLIARSSGGGPTTNVNAFSVTEIPGTNAYYSVTVDDAASSTNSSRRFIRLKITK